MSQVVMVMVLKADVSGGAVLGGESCHKLVLHFGDDGLSVHALLCLPQHQQMEKLQRIRCKITCSEPY